MAWFHKGIVLGKLAKSDEVLTCFDKAIEIDPQFAAACPIKT